jgi:cytochrome c oxidase assembly protein subunit 11
LKERVNEREPGDSRLHFLKRRLNKAMFGKLVVVTVLMFGFGYALVPLYRKICEITGVNELTQTDAGASNFAQNTQVDMTRTITVEFDGNARGPWRFAPAVHSLKVHPGELTTMMYEIANQEPRAMQAQAIPSYAPQTAMPYFRKVECFCFKQQSLAPHESKQYPVVFVIDPKIPKNVDTITLSYTFFEVGGPPTAAVADPRG